ncbi:MAG: S-layer homology domain-containing protein [Clostridia bacterium]|nr:S-layer homology domain-containing protein [Clostridia bacterium]
MKKLLSLLISTVLILSAGIGVQAARFSDLAENHWAYQNIMTLVEEGTINGYEDGTFRPSKTVTRAEFVKMIGKWDRKYEGTYSDLVTNHWGYEYLMWSGLDPIGTNIYPDAEMLRTDVINLIWKRNGSPAHSDAPYAISTQGTNKAATSWAYTIGLVQGDDGFNLHLDRALTRAEAATLIVRARSVVAANKTFNFVDVVNDDLLAQVIASSQLFPGKTYDENATVTYGELSRAAILLGLGGKYLTYDSYSLDSSDLFDHTYTKDMYVTASKLWGMDYYTPEVADKAATLQDSISALVYGMARRSGESVSLGKMDAYYSDAVSPKSTNMENLCLSYAAINGIKLVAGTKLGEQRTATMKDIAAILLQLNELSGLGTCYTNGKEQNVKLNMDLATYPANYKDFANLPAGVPGKAYGLKQQATNPGKYYQKASDLSFVFTAFLSEVKAVVKSNVNADIDLVFYPSLTYEENSGLTFIVKCVSSKGSIAVDTVFSKFIKNKTGLTVEEKQPFYIAFATYEPLLDIYLPYTGGYIKSVIIP